MRLNNRLRKKALKSHKPKHWDEFKKEQNLVSRLVKQSHSSYLNDIIGASLDTNPKKFWFYVRTSKSDSSGIPPLKFNDKLCVSDKSKADALNFQFHSVFTRENAPIPNKGQYPYTFISDFINSQDVAKQLSELNPSKACDPDEIPARILKKLSSSISCWLCFIFQQFYDSGTLPPDCKAFDSVPHLRLKSKLDHYGIRGLSANWIKAFLSNRSQVVSVNGSHSRPQPVVSGVPQGTILAPVLFVLYINDISENIKSQTRLFADDGIIYREINND
ncbi:Hypothetical predicted protein [Paramuricea clavata]|uniref:Reverse transcriptase domain-containing protein n=1 Tax=Paramuricea clavata TaxID=317549 RepID=A0A7D9E658_PARCT|nr:Hypothetical predicted protein [Paramuricea clavata]